MNTLEKLYKFTTRLTKDVNKEDKCMSCAFVRVYACVRRRACAGARVYGCTCICDVQPRVSSCMYSHVRACLGEAASVQTSHASKYQHHPHNRHGAWDPCPAGRG